MIKTQAAGGIVLNVKGEIALVRSGTDGVFWGFPKGHVDSGEDAIAAAKREIEEETGLTHLSLIRAFAPYVRHRGTYSGGDDPAEVKTIYMFLFETEEETLAPKDAWNPEARWVSPADVEELLTHPKDREFFRNADLTR